MNTTSYVFASCKPWHRTGYETLKKINNSIWEWVETPEQLIDTVRRLTPRYVFFVHWSWRVPTEIWMNFECVCFHMTDLPYGRGGSPLQNLILAGHGETKLTALKMVDEMDAGPVYAKRQLALSGRAEDIYIRAGQQSVEMIEWVVREEPTPLPQQGEVFRFQRRKPAQSQLPLEWNLKMLYDHIRMLDAPTYPYAFIDHGDVRIEFSDASIMAGDELHAKVVLRKKSQDKINEHIN